VAADVSATALVPALRAGFALDAAARAEYAEAAVAAVARYRPERVLELVRTEVLPALGLS
jgi:hypothetical protein